jgi:DNA-binding CsgD family transcriptional regulator
MSIEVVYRSVKRACYAGLDSVTMRREVAARVAPAVPYDKYAFSTCDPDTGLMTHTVGDGVHSDLARAYVERLYPRYCGCLTIDMARAGVAVFSMVELSPPVRDVLAAHGFDEQLEVSLVADGRMWGTWCMMRGDDAPPVREAERALLRRLAPHVARGLQAAARVDQALAARGAAADDDADHAPGILVLDERVRPTLRTAPAAAWLADIADVGLEMPHGLPLAVHALVVRLRAARVDVPGDARVRIRGRSGRWYVLRASLAEPDAAGERAAVVVVRPAVPREVATLLTRVYGLSAREREVVAAVARGESTKEIAAALGLSPHTVLEHLDRACGKIGARGRKALLAKLFFDGYAPLLERPA